MKAKSIAYEDAIDLLDADHKGVKQMFIDYGALVADGADGRARDALAARICLALTVHDALEEEIFYPAVREATADEALISRADQDHGEVRARVAEIGKSLGSGSPDDQAVIDLGLLVDKHVLLEREQIFLEARQSSLDLKALAVPLAERAKKLKAAAPALPKESE